MNRTFLGSSGQGHTMSWLTPNPLEGPANDRTTASSYDGGMASGSTLVPASPRQGISTSSTSWPANGCSASGLAASPPDPNNSN